MTKCVRSPESFPWNGWYAHPLFTTQDAHIAARARDYSRADQIKNSLPESIGGLADWDRRGFGAMGWFWLFRKSALVDINMKPRDYQA